jgi:DNA modification methylase
MFSFVGDTVLDPFVGTGTTVIAAVTRQRNAIGVEIDPRYYCQAKQRVEFELNTLFSKPLFVGP